MNEYEFIIKNLDCANCANKIQRVLSENEDLKDVIVNFNTLKLKYKTSNLTKQDVEAIIKKIEPDVELIDKQTNKIENKSGKEVLRLIIGMIIAGIGLFVIQDKRLANIFIILGYGILLYRTAKNAAKLIKQSYTINENFLVTISCIGAYLIGKQLEGFMVILLYEIGKILEEKAINRTRKSISDLMNIKPEYANLKNGNEIEKVSPESIQIGDILIIKQGEKVPLDGTIVEGKASLDVSSLTGESNLKNVGENDKVLSGSIVANGMIEIKVTKTYENSTVSKILELVEHATEKKTKTETFVNKVAKIYTPTVLAFAILIALILPLVSNVGFIGTDGSIYRALIFLVISCPCAIAISVPLSYFSGIGKSSKQGILIKGSNFLDIIKDVKEIVFDKTGTLTKGEFSIQKIEVVDTNYKEEDILKYATTGERYSNHPIAKSILKNKLVYEEEITDFKEIPGEGISYKINNTCVFVGRAKENEDKADENTKLQVELNNKLIGIIYLADTIKEEAKETIDDLKSMNIKTKMFTGDSKEVALKVGEKINIDEINYQMLPNEKYKEFEKLINDKYKVAFVGDGINDSPVLALADVGISMGGVRNSFCNRSIRHCNNDR